MTHDEGEGKEPEHRALAFLGDHRFAAFARGAVQVVAFVSALYGSFLVGFAPPSPVGQTAIGLVSLGAFLIVLIIELYAGASSWWARSLWPLLGVSVVLLILSTVAYVKAHDYHVGTTPIGHTFIRGDKLLPGAEQLCPKTVYATIGDCLDYHASQLETMPVSLYGEDAIADAHDRLLFRYLMFGLSLFLSLTIVLEALVWNKARQDARAERAKARKPKKKP